MSQSYAVHGAGVALALTTSQRGITLLPQATPLTRLNYFDGKFLRAADLAREQGYLRDLAALGNQGGGAGVVHGFSVGLRGAALQLESGLAIDRDGHVLLLTETRLVDVGQLIEASRETARTTRAKSEGGSPEFKTCTVELAPSGPGTGIPSTDLYLLTICLAEELCGQEDVLGALCEEACATTTGRPFRVEGVVLRAEPLRLPAIKTSQAVAFGPEHLRSLVASAYYESERRAEGGGRLISGEGLRSAEWCGGAGHRGGCEVALGVLARSGEGVVFLDAWTARRERMESHPRRQWAFAMAMRPWDVFLAQVLQFQCQLHELLEREQEPTAQEARAPHRQVLTATAAYLEGLEKQVARQPGVRSLSVADLPGGATALAQLRDRLHGALEQAVVPDSRMLIRGGIVELPPAGYLPVRRGIPVNDQVRAWMGEGVDLQFCTVRPDYVPHALEEAQHMERISLLEGLDDPARRPHVDVLVPNGEVLGAEAGPEGQAYEGRVDFGVKGTSVALGYEGVGRAQRLAGGGAAFHFGGAGQNTRGGLLAFASFMMERKPGEAVEGSLGRVKQAPSVVKSRAFHKVLGSFATNARRLTFAHRASFFDSPTLPKPVDVGEFLGDETENVDAAWITVQTDRDISSLTDADGSATVSARAVLATGDNKKITAFDVTLNGSFNLMQTYADQADGRQVDGMLPVNVIASLVKTVGGSEAEVTLGLHFDLGVRLVYRGDEHEGSVATTLFQQKTQAAPAIPLLEIDTSWTGSGSTLDVKVLSPAAKKTKQGLQLATGYFSASPGVLSEDDDHHHLATNAIDVVQTALLSEPAFESTAKGLLFAPLGETAVAPLVKAVEDWVLFHRRRTKTCKPVPERPAAEPPRKYRVFELTVESAKEAKALFDSIRTPDDAEQAKVRKVLLKEKEPALYVEFEGGSDDVSEVEAAFAEDWRQFEPGKHLAYALIARPNPSDRLLEQRRLESVKAAIPQDLTYTRSMIKEEVLTEVPPALADAAADGSILFITIALPAERHRVVGGALSPQQWKMFVESLGQAQVVADADVQALYKRFELTEVDDTDFQGGTATFADQEDAGLRTAWAGTRFAGAAFSFGGLWVPRAEEQPGVELERRRAQTLAIDSALFPGLRAEPPQVFSANLDPSALNPGQDGKTCIAVTFVLVDQPVEVLFALRREQTVPAGVPGLIVKRSHAGAVVADPDELKRFVKAVAKATGGQFSVQLETDDDPAANETAERSKALLDLLMKAGLPPAKDRGPIKSSELAKKIRGRAADVFFIVMG